MPSKRPPVDKRSVSKKDLDRLPKFQEGGVAGSVLNRLLPSEQKKIEETAAYYDKYNDLVAEYNQKLKDYEQQYGLASAEHNKLVDQFNAEQQAALARYNQELEEYNRRGEEYQRTQVDPYNAALAQYQQQVADYQNRARAYEEQALAAQKVYEQQYADYERQYQDYANQYKEYEARAAAYQPTIDVVQGELEFYQRPYAQDLGNLEASSNYYNYVYNDIYQRNMNRANDYASRAQRMREDPWWMMYEGQFGRTPETYDQLAANLRSQAEVVIPDINRAADDMERYQGNLQRAGFSFDHYNTLINKLNTVVRNAPPAPTFNVQAPVLDLKPFGEPEPVFNMQAPQFTLQKPEFTFDKPAPVFNFATPQPERPVAPEMNPEELQAYQERAQKLAGYRASGLEKAFEMGMLPEIAQYFKKGPSTSGGLM
jgi:hypothetical protein